MPVLFLLVGVSSEHSDPICHRKERCAPSSQLMICFSLLLQTDCLPSLQLRKELMKIQCYERVKNLWGRWGAPPPPTFAIHKNSLAISVFTQDTPCSASTSSLRYDIFTVLACRSFPCSPPHIHRLWAGASYEHIRAPTPDQCCFHIVAPSPPLKPLLPGGTVISAICPTQDTAGCLSPSL